MGYMEQITALLQAMVASDRKFDFLRGLWTRKYPLYNGIHCYK